LAKIYICHYVDETDADHPFGSLETTKGSTGGITAGQTKKRGGLRGTPLEES